MRALVGFKYSALNPLDVSVWNFPFFDEINIDLHADLYLIGNEGLPATML